MPPAALSQLCEPSVHGCGVGGGVGTGVCTGVSVVGVVGGCCVGIGVGPAATGEHVWPPCGMAQPLLQ